MATNEEMLVSAFQEKVAIRSTFNLQICSAMSANDLINFWDQTISKYFKYCNFNLTQEMQNDWTLVIKQNVMSHTRITHDKLHTKKSKMATSRPFEKNFFFFFSISEILQDS